MKSTIEQIINEALNLRPSERAVLAQKLISSLSTDEDSIEQEWLDLSIQRVKQIQNKKVSTVSWK